MKPLKITKRKWKKLREQLLLDYPLSAVIIRWKMKEVLGFTIREGDRWSIDSYIYLDFFDEKKRSFFILKYSEYFDGID